MAEPKANLLTSQPSVEVYRLEDNTYILDAEYKGETHVRSPILDGFILPVADIFSES